MSQPASSGTARVRTGGGLEIRVLGPLEVLADGVPVAVDTRKALAILVLLAVDGRPYARDELAALLWPDADDASARGALRRTLSVLRTALGDRWLDAGRSVVDLGRDGVRLDLDVVEAAGRVAGGPRELPALEAAARVARGPFLAGFQLRDSVEFDDWRATRATSVERQVLAVLGRLATVAGERGDMATALAAATRLVALDPLDEGARRRVMALLARNGDRAAAIREYRATVVVLERELGVAPLLETTELYEAIREGVGQAPAPGQPVGGSLPASLASPASPASPASVPQVAPAHATGVVAPVRLPMAGREADLRTLLETHAASSGDGQVAVVVGEAGVGKSRLVETLVSVVANEGGRAIAARAFPAEGSIAFGLVAELVRSGMRLRDADTRLEALPTTVRREIGRVVALPDDLAPDPDPGPMAVDPAGARGRLLDAIATVLTALAAGRGPGLLVAEDIQWADGASAEALLYLARRLRGRSLLLVVTWRPEDVDAPTYPSTEAFVGLAGTAAIRPDRLTERHVAELVDAAARAGLPPWESARLHAESEGLPLYVVEALAAGPGGPTPRGVRALLRERLASVGEAAAQVLAACAVVGRTFDLATVRGASGRTEEETVTGLEELVRRGLVREVAGARASGKDAGPVYDFVHASLRDAAYDAIGLARRRLLHRRVADVVRQQPGDRDDYRRLAQVAGHEQAAGRDEVAADAYRQAGLGARRVFALRESLAHLETALALGPGDDPELLVAIGELRTATADYAGAVTALEAAAALAGDEALPGIELLLGRVHARRGDVVTAASHLDAALAGLDALADRPLPDGWRDQLVQALVERAVVAIRAGDLELAAGLGQRARSLAGDEPGTTAAAALRLEGLVALRRGDATGARAALAASLACAPPDDPAAAIAARNGLALALAAAGDRSGAIDMLEQALADCRRTGEIHLEAAVENNLADQFHAVGDPDAAMAHLKRAVALFAEVGGRPGELEPEIWRLVAW